MNPLFNNPTPASSGGLTIDPNMIASVKRMMGTLKTAQNPTAAIAEAAKQNPMLGAVMSMLGGRNPDAAFREECQKNGIDPSQILNMLK